MTGKNKKIILIILAFIVGIQICIMPFFIQKNNDDLINYDKKQPTSLQDIKLGQDFTSELEMYVNEHLPFRHDVISLWSNLMYKLGVSVKPNNVIVGKDGWLFLGNGYHQEVNAHRGLQSISDEEIDNESNRIMTLKNYCAENNIEFYFIVPPDKSSIYPEHLPNWYTKNSNPRYIEKLMDCLYLKDAVSYTVFLEDALLKAKQNYGDLLYYKSDSHWTQLGAYIGYSVMMDKIIATSGLEYKKVSFGGYSVNPYEATDIKLILGINTDVRDHLVDTCIDPSGSIEEIEITPYLKKYENKDALTDKTAICFSDSFFEVMLLFLGNTFENIYVMNYDKALLANNIQAFYDMIELYSPDMILFEVIERDVQYALHIMPDTF